MMSVSILVSDTKDGRYIRIYPNLKCIMSYFQAERVISFVPPDGTFRLLSFNITNQGCVIICVLTSYSLDSFGDGTGCIHNQLIQIYSSFKDVFVNSF